jgi:tetratricopeptide (TPR) repeat protein
MEKAVSLDPGHVDYQLLLGNAHKKAGNFLKAKELYDNALRLSPNNIDVWIEAIDNLQIEGLHADALALIADATGSVAANLRIGFRRFVSLHASAQRKEAFKLFDILLERESTENRELIEYYPEIQEDPDFCMRTSHRRKA